MRILSIDTSCDETAAAVTENLNILSNIVWSQASLHTKFGGVMPSLAQREHEKRIDFVINKSLISSKSQIENCDTIAVTVGPGLSIALNVGVTKAKQLAIKYKKPLIAVNHLEGHILSPLANNNLNIPFPALGLVISGKNTLFVQIDRIGKYKTLATCTDDALGEALDKAARMLGLGYPGGAILEKFAKLGNPKKYNLPTPLLGQEKRMIFTYSGLKSAFFRLVEKEKPLTKKKICDLAASFQNVAFSHLTRIMHFILSNHYSPAIKHLLIGGGVVANTEVRKRLRKLCRQFHITPLFPYSKKLYGDNAAMIGVAAYFKALRQEFINPVTIDRHPSLKIDDKFDS